MTQENKQFQKCRWYDPYPRLAFALQVLNFAPEPLKIKAWELVLNETESALSRMVQEEQHASKSTLDGLMADWMAEQHSANRQWIQEGRPERQYDQAELGKRALMMLKNSPDTVKHRVADKLLTLLMQAA